jgi:putative oxidoreductase
MSEVPHHWYAKLHAEFAEMASWLQSPFLLVVRLYWGVLFAQAGWSKLHELVRVTSFFTGLGIPLPGLMAHVVAVVEFVGGLLLILGLSSRFAALLLTATMFVAYYTANLTALKSFFSAPDSFTAAPPFSYLIASLIILIFGAGGLAVDHLLRHHFELKRQRKAAAQAAAD